MTFEELRRWGDRIKANAARMISDCEQLLQTARAIHRRGSTRSNPAPGDAPENMEVDGPGSESTQAE